jgi:FkbH-like protein
LPGGLVDLDDERRSSAMKRAPGQLDRAFEAASAAQMRAVLPHPLPALTLPQVMELTRHLQSLGEAVCPVRIGVIHTYTSEPLDPYLHFAAALQGLRADLHHAPYGVTVQESQDGSALQAYAPDLTLLLLRWEDLHPALTMGLTTLDPEGRREVATRVLEVAIHLTGKFQRTIGGYVVLTLLPPMVGPGLGLYDAGAEASEVAWRAAVKAEIGRRLAIELASVSLLDLDDIVAEVGRRRFFDRRWWYTSRFPFTTEAAQELARRVIALAAVMKLPRAKVIALDADNTLWGGIVGEDGINGIALGPDYPGRAYVQFQERLLDYQQRGFLLALCSKNNLEDVLEVLRRHPHQVLREEHLAAMRVNWEPKSANLPSLADELNLGLESFVFIDDSDHECLMVRQSWPMVEVVQVPARAVDIPTCLDSVARLEVLQFTAEDRRRTEMYVQERKRREMAEAHTDVESYLKSLDMRMAVGVDDAGQVARIAQLTQKTNQFNLTTRRYTEAEVRAFVDSPEWLVAHFSLTDVFGDSGLVGVALSHVSAPDTAELDTLLMSCRVIGRQAETAFLESVLSLLRQRGVRTVLADYVPTAKNKLVEGFLPAHAFTRREDGRFTRDLTAPPPASASELPIAVRVEGLTHELSV